ncbi:MAG TPA: hypothetical protein VEL07_06980 [Planctomycetota bacterium]|nr:hypothetical protein [Planctomycetota bacterium]
MRHIAIPLTILIASVAGIAGAGEAGDNGQGRPEPTPEQRDAWLKERQPEVFAQADTNKDGTLDETERAGLPQLMAAGALAKHDTNKDGGVDKAELTAALKTLGEERAKRRGGDKAEGGAGGDKAADPAAATELAARAEKAFAEADADKNGKLDAQELIKALPQGRRGRQGGEKPADK